MHIYIFQFIVLNSGICFPLKTTNNPCEQARCARGRRDERRNEMILGVKMSILGRFTNAIRENNQNVSIWGLNFQITKT